MAKCKFASLVSRVSLTRVYSLVEWKNEKRKGVRSQKVKKENVDQGGNRTPDFHP